MTTWKRALLASGAAAALALLSGSASAQQGVELLTEPMELEVGREHTQIVLSWDHTGFSTTTAVFREFEGSVHLDPVNVENSTLNVTIDVGSLDTFFDTRTDVLLSERFLNAAAFPEATFVSTEVVRTGDNTADIKGDFTLMGKTYPLTLATTFNKAGEYMGAFVVGFDAETTIPRGDFGLTDLVPNVAPDIKVQITAELLRPKE